MPPHTNNSGFSGNNVRRGLAEVCLATGADGNDAVMEQTRSNVRILLPDQARELVQLHRSALERVSISAAPHHVLSAIGNIVGTKVAVVGQADGKWTVRAESVGQPALPPFGAIGAVLDRIGGLPSVVVECWTSGDQEWTLVTVPRRDAAPAVLMLFR